MEQEKQIQQQDQYQKRQKTHHPVDIHKFLSCQLFQIADRHQVRRTAQRRAEAADACTPDDRQQDRHCQLTVFDVFLANKLQHGYRYRYQDRTDDHIRQKDGQYRRYQQPDCYLLPQRRADTAQGLDRQPLVEPRRRPGQADQISAEQQHDDLRKILTDNVLHRDQVKQCVDTDRHERRHRNIDRPQYPPQRHPDRRPQRRSRFEAKEPFQQQYRQAEAERPQQYRYAVQAALAFTSVHNPIPFLLSNYFYCRMVV